MRITSQSCSCSSSSKRCNREWASRDMVSTLRNQLQFACFFASASLQHPRSTLNTALGTATAAVAWPSIHQFNASDGNLKCSAECVNVALRWPRGARLVSIDSSSTSSTCWRRDATYRRPFVVLVTAASSSGPAVSTRWSRRAAAERGTG